MLIRMALFSGRVFLARGWTRVGVEKPTAPSWLDGEELRKFDFALVRPPVDHHPRCSPWRKFGARGPERPPARHRGYRKGDVCATPLAVLAICKRPQPTARVGQ